MSAESLIAEKTNKPQTGSRHQATGRRKRATASVWLTRGSGNITVNGRDFEDYFVTPFQQDMATASLRLAGPQKDFDLTIKVKGGGLDGQAGAVRHAIARALLKMDENLKSKLKSAGYLTRDPREKERKKSGQPGARKRFQFSKR
jgi:small subunit ribosomal protein S9